MAVERLKAEDIPLKVGQGVGVVAEGRLLKAVLRMLPNPLEGSTRDHVAAPDVLVAPALGQFGQGPIVDRVGDAVADEVSPERFRVPGLEPLDGCQNNDDEQCGTIHGFLRGSIAGDIISQEWPGQLMPILDHSHSLVTCPLSRTGSSPWATGPGGRFQGSGHGTRRARVQRKTEKRDLSPGHS